MQALPSIATTADALREFGLLTRGGFNSDNDALPAAPGGRPAKAIVLVGVAGSGFWPVFSASPEFSDGRNDPLDRWSRRVGLAVASRLDASCVFPFRGPPYQPFLAWGERAESLNRSKLGMTIHPDYGLWHAYRFALLFDRALSDAPRESAPKDICAACTAEPCLKTCPVDAFSDTGYDVVACCDYLRANPEAACHTAGCLARRACPEAPAYRYTSEHAAFHMAAFVQAQARHVDDDRLSTSRRP